jgi:hypothetical protein
MEGDKFGTFEQQGIDLPENMAVIDANHRKPQLAHGASLPDALKPGIARRHLPPSNSTPAMASSVPSLVPMLRGLVTPAHS